MYDQSDHSYCVIYKDGGHGHVMEYDLFKAPQKISEKRTKTLLKRLEEC